MNRIRFTPLRAAIATVIFAALVVGLTVFTDAGAVTVAGWVVLFLAGFVWLVYAVERTARRIELRKRPVGWRGPLHVAISGEVTDEQLGGRNPLDPAAWYYSYSASWVCFLFFLLLAVASWGTRAFAPRLHLDLRSFPGSALEDAAAMTTILAMLALAALISHNRRLRQSFALFAAYSFLFALAYFLTHLQFGQAAANSYELPSGGGSDSIKATTVKVQKIVRKKFVINPYSSILFAAPPPLDQIDVKLAEETANQYKAGQGGGGLGDGEGEGGGYGGGTGTGKIRFIRLRHSDKLWDKNFGIGGDRNLLAELVAREPKMRGKVAEDPEAIDIATLGTFPAKKSPPLVYIGGAHTFAPSASDKKVLKQYLTERHGMILADNLGGSGFQSNFAAVMNEILAPATAVPIPRDDRIHQRPYELPLLPIVVAHGGTVPYGWKIDGRWAVYLHPGALSDAWRDDRAGIKKDIAELCYQLGINIIDYSHRGYGQWLRSQQP